jgi:hypothetical protein
MERVKTVPKDGPLQSRVVVTLCGGEQLEGTVKRYHGNVADPLSEDERLGKFHECAATLAPQAQRDRIIDLTAQLDGLPDARELAAELGVPEHPQRGEMHRGL